MHRTVVYLICVKGALLLRRDTVVRVNATSKEKNMISSPLASLDGNASAASRNSAQKAKVSKQYQKKSHLDHSEYSKESQPFFLW